MNSPRFSSFRQIMDDWDANLAEARIEAIQDLVNFPGFVLMFKKDNGLFAAPEDSRLIFAKLKTEDDEDWTQDATFGAFDLIKALSGEKVQSLFSAKDLDNIEVMTDKDSICKILDKKAAAADDPIAGIRKAIELLGEE